MNSNVANVHNVTDGPHWGKSRARSICWQHCDSQERRSGPYNGLWRPEASYLSPTCAMQPPEHRASRCARSEGRLVCIHRIDVFFFYFFLLFLPSPPTESGIIPWWEHGSLVSVSSSAWKLFSLRYGNRGSWPAGGKIRINCFTRSFVFHSK